MTELMPDGAFDQLRTRQKPNRESHGLVIKNACDQTHTEMGPVIKLGTGPDGARDPTSGGGTKGPRSNSQGANCTRAGL